MRAVFKGNRNHDANATTGRDRYRKVSQAAQIPSQLPGFRDVRHGDSLFDGLRPYQQVPFQFSLHVQRSKAAALAHHSFLAEGRCDPRPEFMRRLRDVLLVQGSLVAFNAPFELGRLKECSALLPEFRPWVAGIERRIVDLLLPFRRFHFYHLAQNGSASMKAVLPALTGRGYDQLAIRDGGRASQEFIRVHFGNVPDDERERVRRQLEECRALDTMGMVRIVDALHSACQTP